jgi:hypothetical protein
MSDTLRGFCKQGITGPSYGAWTYHAVVSSAMGAPWATLSATR